MNPTRGTTVQALVAFGFAFLVSGGAGIAQQPSQAQVSAIRQACPADYRTYCGSVPTGGPAALECLKEHAQSLSSPCRQAVNAIAGPAPSPGPPATAAPAAPPRAPAAPAVPAYRAPPPLSPRQEAMLLRRACGPDFRAYCRGVQPGGGRIIECLEANGPYLSRQCRSALAPAREGR
jgi:hypothetical protein